MPETTYHRFPTQLVTADQEKSTESNGREEESSKDIKDVPPDPESLRSVSIKPMSYWQELRVYNGIYPSRASFLTLLIRPFVACLTPVCLWASLLYGVAITWLVLIATSVAQIFSAPREFGRSLDILTGILNVYSL